jgi:putative membrane protein
MKLFTHLFFSTLSVLVAAYIIPGVVVAGFLSAFTLAVVLGILNTILRPVLLFLTFPLTVITLGLFSLVVNTVLILLATYLVPGFFVSSFFQAFLFGIVLFFVNSFFFAFFDEKKDK